MTVTNAEWMIKNGYKFYDLDCVFNRKEKICDIFIKHTRIDTVKVNKNESGIDTIFKWLDMKHKEQILDDAEKRYLSGVIRPFKNDVTSIVKSTTLLDSGRFEEIIIEYDRFEDKFGFDLPPFKCGTMYKGMKVGKRYKPEELGL